MSITWNGVSSDTIGVIVERIPNRYVPTRRFSPQQVAGRNGNILLVDKSFPNVEQEYEVYLSAEAQGLPYVARACAEWLMGPDGYCRLEDSYDTTVYREAFLMGGYDLENILNKFGRCTITFSCKPQKYLLAGDTPIEIPAGSTTTYTGSSVQFDGITGASITSLSATIEPIQDLHGYANPWPAGGGVNKLPPTVAETKSENGLSCTSDGNGNFTFSGTLSGTFNQTFADIGTAYVIQSGDYLHCLNSVASSSVLMYLYFTDNTNTYAILSTTNKIQSLSGNEGKTVKAIRFYVGAQYNATVSPMIVNSNTSTEFEPWENICPISGLTGLSVYVSPTQDPDDATTYAVDWTTQAGTVYGGTVDVVTGVMTVDRATVTYNGTESWAKASGQNAFYTTLNAMERPADNTYIGKIICDKLQTCIGSSIVDFVSAENGITGYIGGGYLGQNWIYAKANGATTAAEFKAWLTNNPIQVVYSLATPQTYQLTPQEIEALVGTNNVWSSSGDVSVTVMSPLGGIVTNPTPFEARPMLEVSGIGEITINGKSIQILEAVSDFNIDCETMEADDNSKIYCMDFPELSGGENEIVGDGSITALTVTPRWWTL